MPAAVQVSAANTITFTGNRFVNLGQIGLGIGNDANAHATGVGLGASNITVDRQHRSSTVSAGGIVVGGVQADAHHPSDSADDQQQHQRQQQPSSTTSGSTTGPRRSCTTYTNGRRAHNEVYNLPYSGIAPRLRLGRQRRGRQPTTTPTAACTTTSRATPRPPPRRTTELTANYVHDVMQQMTDGGCIYTSRPAPARPSTRTTAATNGWFGLYFDEGSRYVSAANNVFDNTGTWAYGHYWANNNTGNLTLTNNWTTNSGTQRDQRDRGQRQHRNGRRHRRQLAEGRAGRHGRGRAGDRIPVPQDRI